jgi:hypothetical protein
MSVSKPARIAAVNPEPKQVEEAKTEPTKIIEEHAKNSEPQK